MTKRKKQPEIAANADCRVCASPLRLQLLTLRSLGATIAEQVDAGDGEFSEAEINRHFQHVLAVPSSKELMGAVDATLQGLITQADELFSAASLTGDTHGAAAGLSVKLRACSEFGRRTARKQDKTEMLDKADPHDPATWSPALTDFVRRYLDELILETENAS